MSSSTHPTHLDPSELGTKDYWDKYYSNDLSNLSSTKAQQANSHGDGDDDDGHTTQIDPEDLPSWFSDHSAPSKVLRYLTSPSFPLSPSHWQSSSSNTSSFPISSSGPSILDLGTGNGSLLFLLRTSGPFVSNRMCGIDYSATSIALARRLGQDIGQGCQDIEFETCDIIRDEWRSAMWWPKTHDADATTTEPDSKPESESGWDIVLDKGTFDAVSLSAETVDVAGGGTPSSSQPTRICDLYPSLAARMVRCGGYLIITSCNWTEDELRSWFVPADGVERSRWGGARLELFDSVPYSSFRFGGGEGQGVCTLCFRRVE